MKLKGKIAVVTGAAIGIGNAIARALAKEGAHVVVADISKAEQAAQAMRNEGHAASALKLDVSLSTQWRAGAARLESEFGGVDILINNAGLFASLTRVPFEELSEEEWRRVMDVNVFSIFAGGQAIVPLMRKRGGGHILNVSSASVYKGPPNLMHYVTSKAAVTMMTQILARELGTDNICVNSIAPGFTLSDGVLNRKDPIEWQRQMNNNARSIKRDQVPEDIIGAAVFLCSEAAAFITGQALVIDGGIVFH